MNQNAMLEAALRYASWGWPVLPLQPNSKIPATAHGVHDATRDPEQIRKWWGRQPDCNIGVAAGKASGLLVFDVDPRNGGEAGWEDWVGANGPHPEGAMQLTAGGGYHFLGQYTDAMRSCKLATGVDLLSDGRYFVVHPSVIDGRTYEWEGSSDPAEGVGPFPVPKRWLDAYQGRRTEAQQRTPDTILQGGRNEGLLSAGGTMRNAGFSGEEILSALLVMNERRCDPPLPETEVRRVAKSAARYEPARDVAGDMARGTVAAEAILRPEPENDFLNRLDDVDAQPAPMKWLIKPWLPEQGLCMIHGPSGSGKTFVLMNWLLHIATEMQEWNGGKVATGPVIYLAGEGHYGLRARSRGWKAFHRISESLIFISTHGIDLNTPEGWNQVVSAIQAATPDAPPCVIAIDTLNRHMRGDENSAQDAKSMIDAMDRLQRLYACLVINNHHTGNNEEAQHRARGSSAWRAAMDIEISITPGKRDRPGKITMKKSKDTELTEPVYFKLQQIDVPGWYDDEGQPVSTAIPVVVEGAAEEEERGEGRRDRVSKHAEFIRLMERGWFAGEAEIKDGLPYIKREALQQMLLGDDRSERTVTNDLTPSRGNALIGFLLNSETIAKTEGGWLMQDATVISQWQMKTRGRALP